MLGDRARSPLQRRDERGRRLRMHLVGRRPDPRASALQARCSRSSGFFSAGGAAVRSRAQRSTAIELGRVHRRGRARPGCAPRRPARRRAIRWPASARAASRCRRSSSCSRRRRRRPSARAPGRGSTGRPRAPGRSARRRRAVSEAAAHGGVARGRQAVVEAPRERARVAMAGLVGMLAGLVARDELEHAQRQRGIGFAQGADRLQRERAARALGGEEEELVELLRRAGLEQRKERADGLADAGRRLRQRGSGRAARRGTPPRRARAGRCGTPGAESAARSSARIAPFAVRQLRSAQARKRSQSASKNRCSSAAVWRSTSDVFAPARRCRSRPARRRASAARAAGTAASRRPWPAPSAGAGGSPACVEIARDRS